MEKKEKELLKSPPPCPNTVTIRRNPHRRARPTPSSAVPFPLPISSSPIPPFPIEDILSVEVAKERPPPDLPPHNSESLKVFLRIRPLNVKIDLRKHRKIEESKIVWPKNPKSKGVNRKKMKSRNESFVTVNDNHSITVLPPLNLQNAKRVKSEVYGGFSEVFSAEASQIEVYDKMVKPLVEDFLNGKSGMLAAMGPSGSGKTHTVFGCPKNPGMVPLALHRIFSEDERNGTRTFYLSVFEICSERGKSEKMYDLLRRGADLYLQQSTLKGLQKVKISDVQQAESLIACAMLERATAMTNSNSQSSRSQCIINISCDPKNVERDGENESHSPVLTIVDLAGAEREKRTGNQGLRLLESNFINNTSMVFGLCLRALLEHQKNPKRPLQKHFQSSLLTKYLRAYLEGKKRMALVLTAKSGEEDYLDTSNLLKQASPYTEIKFTSTEEPGNIKFPKRPLQNFPRAEQLKKMKFYELEASLIDEGRGHEDQLTAEEKLEDASLTDIFVESEESLPSQSNGGDCLTKNDVGLVKRNREQEIMLNFSKALWNVLKQYKMKLEMAENENSCLKDNLMNEKKRCSDLETELNDLKRQYSDWEEDSAKVSVIEFLESRSDHSPEGSQYTKFQERKFCGSAKASCTEANAFSEQLSRDTGDQLQSLHTHDCDTESSSASRDFGTEEAITTVEGTPKLITSQTCSNDTGEEADEIANPGENIGDSKYIVEENSFSISNANDVLVLKDDNRNEKEESEHSESTVSFSQSSAKVIKIHPCSSLEEDLTVCTSSISEIVVYSSSSPITSSSEDSLASEMKQLSQDEFEEVLDPVPLATLEPEEDVSLACIPKSKSMGKPKRRLLPASCILFKDIGSLTIEDENDKPKGARGEKKGVVDISNKTKGSLSLLRLLRNDFHP